MTSCPNHPAIALPYMLTCPLCAQEARQTAYGRQRGLLMARLSWPAQEPSGGARVAMREPVENTP